jgi:hypothetical protein
MEGFSMVHQKSQMPPSTTQTSSTFPPKKPHLHDSEQPVTGYDSDIIASDLIGIADEIGFDKFRVVGED